MNPLENIPEELTSLPQWVCAWNNTKIPMNARMRKGASVHNPETWSDFQTAREAVESGAYDYVGFVFNNNGIVGIDIDLGFDDTGFLSDISIDVMKACQSFTEKSRSGHGIHIYVKGDLPFDGRNNRKGCEIYKTGRYFIATGRVLVYDKIVENQQAIDYVVEKARAKAQPQKARRFTPPCSINPKTGKSLSNLPIPLSRKGREINPSPRLQGSCTAGDIPKNKSTVNCYGATKKPVRQNSRCAKSKQSLGALRGISDDRLHSRRNRPAVRASLRP